MHVAEATWPYQEFMQYLRTLMDAAGIADHVELYQAANVAQSVYSRWERGESQPSRANLRKIAVALNVPAARLFVAAGLMDAAELNIPAGSIDPAALPRELVELVRLYLDGVLSDAQRSYARRVVADVTAGLRAELATTYPVRPTGHGSSKPRSAGRTLEG